MGMVADDEVRPFDQRLEELIDEVAEAGPPDWADIVSTLREKANQLEDEHG